MYARAVATASPLLATLRCGEMTPGSFARWAGDAGHRPAVRAVLVIARTALRASPLPVSGG